MPSVRSSGFLPALKCSTCGEEVEIALMGDHVCAPPKPAAPATIPEGSEPQNDQQGSPVSPKSLGSPIASKGGFFTRQKNGLPRIDAQAANRPFRPTLPANERSELFITTNNDAPQRPIRQDSLSPPPVPRRNDLGRMVDSPLLYNNENPYAYQADTPNGLQASSPPAASSLYPSPAFNNMYAPASPTVTGGKDVMRRMNAMAPGPFGVNPQPSPLASAFDRRPSGASGASPTSPDRQQLPAMGAQRPSTRDSTASKRRPSQSSIHSHRSRSIGSEGRRRMDDDIPEVPSIDHRLEEDRRRMEEERRQQEIEEERRRQSEYERGRQQMLQEEQKEQERLRSEERERGRQREREQELERQASMQRNASRSISSQSRRPSTANSRRGSNSPNDIRNGSPPTGPLPRPGGKPPIGLPRRPSDKNSPAMMHVRNKSSMASLNQGRPLQPLPSPKYPERSQSQGRTQSPRRPSITARPGTSAGGRPNDEPMPDFDRTQFPANLLPPSRAPQANAHLSLSASSDSSSLASRASTAPSDISTPSSEFMHKKKGSTDSIKDDIDKLMGDLKVAVEQNLAPTPRTPTFPVSPGPGKYQAYQAYNPKSPRPAATSRGPSPSPRPGAMARAFTTPNLGAAPPPKKAAAVKAPCRACNLPITGKGLTSSDGRLTGRYHKDCFVCQTCRNPFQSSTFYVYENLPYCARHYHTLNNSLCPTCDRGIEGPCLETEDGIRYHPTCFLCGDCGVGLGDEYWVVGKGAFCRQHAEMRTRQYRGPGGRGMRGRGGPMGPPGRGGYGPGRGGPGMLGPNGMNNGPNNFMAPPEKMERRRTRLMMM
ncbi:hypothetical protein BJ508DRAFT_322748 [Ascobolus immersus RN42]|uniref:LIM zinc-binding domain-containing protein n=1 Tax=Ascobolus immersus RN42 TaxID=1160509 RepID=A0A3N4IUM9_ASCIM|nr:hypothetical protein BJ508DRAFT_322748 [Ascobolus immersus RN42]